MHTKEVGSFLSFVVPISFTIACARYPIEEIQCDITAASSGTRSWPSQTEHHEFWPEYGPSQDFSNISSLQDNFSDVASEDMRRPVPNFDEEDDVEEGLGQPSSDEDPPQEPEQTETEFDESFQPEDADNLRRIIGDLCAATPPVLSVTMPWELPGISLVLGDETPIVPTPVLHPVPVLEDEPMIVLESHRTARVDRIRGSFHECIDFKLTLADSEILAARWSRALEKWYLIFARGRSGWPEGYDIYDIVSKRGLSGLRPLFGSRSQNTVLKRANSIIRFTHWFTKFSFSITPFPLTAADVEAYLEHLQEQEASPSALSSFVEAVNFCEKVLNIPHVATAITPKAMNICELANSRRHEKRQARVLSVVEVASLEEFLSNERNLIVDRFAAGCFLFALYSRSRWSDLRCVYSHTADIVEIEGKITGYLEYKTRNHKTARLVQKQGLSMPLVAPVWGVGETPWVLEFVKVARLADRPLEHLDQAPMLPAPTEDGQWTDRSTSTLEAKKWLLSILFRSLGQDPDTTTIHCLKSTALSWAGKAGLSAEVRQILGHHSTGKKSHEIYNRDLLADPLRQFDLLLQRIRTGAFLPDSSRSGMMTSAANEDAKDIYRPDPTVNESSESSSTDSSSEDESLGSDQHQDIVYDPILQKESWNPDFRMYKHKRTQVVHLLAEGTTAGSFSCGVKLSGEYIEVETSRFLEFRKCKRCATAKPIKDVGALASALKKQRLESTRA